MQIELASLRKSRGCGQIVMNSSGAAELRTSARRITRPSRVRDQEFTEAGLNFLQRLT
jgi:hypothetical protein